jgi:hypothetical protein
VMSHTGRNIVGDPKGVKTACLHVAERIRPGWLTTLW